jgi:hypothetical protein
MQINIHCETNETGNMFPISLAAAIIQDFPLSVDEVEEVADHLLAYVKKERKGTIWYDDNTTNG